MLLRSSAGEACCRSESLSKAHNFCKEKCIVFTPSIATHRPGTLNTPLQRSPTVQWTPCFWALSWARSFHTVPFALGRYISAERTEARDSSYSEVFGCSNSDVPELPADSETELYAEDSVCEEEKEKVDNFLVINFYVLVHIDDPHLEVARHTAFMENKDICGRILISSQGINAQYSGPREAALAYANWVKEDPRFSSLYVQASPSVDGHAFPRLKLRYKPSLVQVEGGTASLPITDPSSRAVPLSSREWKEKLASSQRSNIMDGSSGPEKDNACQLLQRPVLVLDVRNGYEWDIGHFQGTQRPPVACFKSMEFGLQYNEVKPTSSVKNQNVRF